MTRLPIRRSLFGLMLGVVLGSCTTPEPSPVKEVPVQPKAPAARTYGLDQPEVGEAETLGGDSDFQTSELTGQVGDEVLLGASVDGTPVYLSSYRDKVVLVYYWSLGCDACRKIMSALDRIYGEYRGRGFALVNVNHGDEEQSVASFLSSQSFQLGTAQLRDPAGRAAAAARVHDVPTAVIYDWSGREVARYARQIDVGRVREDLRYLLP